MTANTTAYEFNNGRFERLPDSGFDLYSATAIAEALESCDWSGAPIGNKAILRAAAHALRRFVEVAKREIFEVPEGFEMAPDDGRATGELKPVTPITTVKVTVPVDPTDAMIEAAIGADWECDGDEKAAAINVWHAMLAASENKP